MGPVAEYDFSSFNAYPFPPLEDVYNVTMRTMFCSPETDPYIMVAAATKDPPEPMSKLDAVSIVYEQPGDQLQHKMPLSVHLISQPHKATTTSRFSICLPRHGSCQTLHGMCHMSTAPPSLAY